MSGTRIFTIAAALSAAAFSTHAGTAEFSSGGVAAGGGGHVASVSPVHSQGPDAITLVAAEISGEGSIWTIPALNDDGVGGDAVAGDGRWSLQVDLPGAASGAYSIVFYLVDTDGDESVSDPIDFTLE